VELSIDAVADPGFDHKKKKKKRNYSDWDMALLFVIGEKTMYLTFKLGTNFKFF